MVTSAGLVAVVLSAVVVLGALPACSASRRPIPYTPLGHLVPEQKRVPAGAMTGTLLDGKRYSFTGDRGKVALVNLWATWCPPCGAEAPQLDALYRQVKDGGVNFVGIDTKDPSRSGVESFVSDNHLSYPIVFDEQAKVAVELGDLPASSLPFTVLIDKHSRIAAVYLGPVLPAREPAE